MSGMGALYSTELRPLCGFGTLRTFAGRTRTGDLSLVEILP